MAQPNIIRNTYIEHNCNKTGHQFYTSYYFQDGSNRDRPLVKCLYCGVIDLVRSRQVNLKDKKCCEFCNREMGYNFSYNHWSCWPCKSSVCSEPSNQLSIQEISSGIKNDKIYTYEPPDKTTKFEYV